MREFWGIKILMLQVRKEITEDVWSTDPTISTPIFPLSESIWQAWYFSDSSQQTQDSGWLFKTFPVYEYCVQKYKSVYSPKRELSLDGAMMHGGGPEI